MKNIIIGIHGLGNKPPEALLKRWWRMAITEGLGMNGFNTILPAFKLVYWADILHDKPLDPLMKDVNSPLFLDEKYTKSPEDFHPEDTSTRKKVIDYLGKQMNRIFLNDDLTLNYSFISDAIMDRYFNDLELYYSGYNVSVNNRNITVNELIRERLHKKLLEHKDDNIMLITHSMGTIIAFDVLTFLAPEVKINTFITMGSPLGLPFIISRIAGEKRQRGYSDKIIRVPPGITNKWYNFSDLLDIVAFNYKLSDSFAVNNNGVKPVDIIVTNNYEDDNKKNPHKSFGYLRTPQISEIINEFIMTERLTLKQKFTHRVLNLREKLKSVIPGWVKTSQQ